MLKKLFVSIFVFLSFFSFVNFANAEPAQLNDYIDPLGVSDNPSKTLPDLLGSTVSSVVDQLFGIIGIVALAIFVWAGITYIRALGDSKIAATGLKHMEWSVIGLAVVFLSYAAVKFILDQITKLK